MATVKIAITLDEAIVARLDKLVAENRFPSRSRVVQEAVRDKLDRLKRGRLPASVPNSIRRSRRIWQRRESLRISANGQNTEGRHRLGRS